MSSIGVHGPALSISAIAALASVVGLLAYTLYGVIWRLFLSPIAHIPGPRFAALTFWNEFYYDVTLGGKYTWKLLEYHQQYGPIIRINPYEVHIYDPDFFEEIFVGASKAKSDRWSWSVRMFGQQDVSAFDTLDHDKHRQRREPWNPYFSKQSVARLQPLLIQTVVDKLCIRLAEHQAAGKPVVMTYAFACVATDVISEYSFPQGYNLLDKPEFDSQHYKAWMALTKMGHILKHFGWLYPLLSSMPMWLTKIISPEMYLMLRLQDDLLQQSVAIAKRRGSPDYKEFNSRPSMMQAFMESNLPESEKSPERIKAEAQTAIGGGTLTSTHALKTATYYILANPDIHTRLLEELENSIPDPDNPPNLRQLEQMPYLVAVLHETLRMFHGTSHRLQRIFPSRTVQYKQHVIPPGNVISMTPMHIDENPNIFPDPYTFDPSRWLGANPPLKYLITFGRGSRACVGMELAKAEILTTLANMFRRFGRKMELWNTDRKRDIDVVYDVFNPMPSKESNGLMVMFKPKRTEGVEDG